MSKRRTAIITGASRGIGRAIAVALAGQGFNVVVNYRADARAARQCAAVVKKAGGDPLLVQADIALEQDRQRLVDETIARWGLIDLLVNNAGMAPRNRADLLETTQESFDEVLAVNLKGPYFLTQLVARHMIQKRRQFPKKVTPAIINISSVSAYAASVNRGEYCISKAGLSMMTALFAARLAEHDIQVCELRPGIVATDMTAKVKAKYDEMIFKGGLLPMKRWGRPDDVAKAVVAVTSGLLPYSTGQVIDIDGGFHLRRL